jgi:hypothetical protein
MFRKLDISIATMAVLALIVGFWVTAIADDPDCTNCVDGLIYCGLGPCYLTGSVCLPTQTEVGAYKLFSVRQT